jgi:hypothetical protein
LIASMIASGPAAKRPPHIELAPPVCVSSVIGGIFLSLLDTAKEL